MFSFAIVIFFRETNVRSPAEQWEQYCNAEISRKTLMTLLIVLSDKCEVTEYSCWVLKWLVFEEKKSDKFFFK